MFRMSFSIFRLMLSETKFKMDKKWTLVIFFLFFLVFVFGEPSLELGASTEANTLEADNDAVVTETVVSTRKLPEELGDIIMPSDYDKDLYPPGFQDPQIDLAVGLGKLTFLEEKNKINITLEIEVEWTDVRLKLNPNSNIFGDWELAPLTALEHIWHPTTKIWSNGTEFFNYVSFNNTLELYWKEWNKTDCVECVRFYSRIRVALQDHLDMDYTFFPNDKHLTRFWLATSYFPDFYKPIPVRYAVVAFQRKDFQNDNGFDIRVASTAFTAALSNNGTNGNLAEFDFNVLLERKMASYVLKIYVTSGFFVVLSFLSMLLSPKIAGERVALCATSAVTLLTVTVFYNTAEEDWRRVAYLRAIDIWLLGCTAVVFFILFQSIIILRLAVLESKKGKPKEKEGGVAGSFVDMKQAIIDSLAVRFEQLYERLGLSDLPHKSAPQDNDLESNKAQGLLDKENDQRGITEMVDRVSRISFVLMLAICNGIYWTWLLNLSVSPTCDYDEHCGERLIDTDDYERNVDNLIQSVVDSGQN